MNYKHNILNWVAKPYDKTTRYKISDALGYFVDLIPNELIEHSTDWLPIEERKPIVSLPDENGKKVELFENDMYVSLRISDWDIQERPIYLCAYNPCQDLGFLDFATLKAAEDYVYKHHPVYPAEMVDRWMCAYMLSIKFAKSDYVAEYNQFKQSLK